MATKSVIGGVIATVAAAMTLAVVPLAGVGVARPDTTVAQASPTVSPSTSPDCQKLRDDLSGALAEITSLLQTGVPDPGKIMPLVRKAVQAVRELVRSGCLFNPMSVRPTAGASKIVTGEPAVDPCAVPAAELMSRVYALLAVTLEAQRTGSTDGVPMLREASQAQDVVAGLSTAHAGRKACLSAK